MGIQVKMTPKIECTLCIDLKISNDTLRGFIWMQISIEFHLHHNEIPQPCYPNIFWIHIPFFFRSQVVREACITVAYMSQVLRLKVDRFLEALMQNIINLIPNSAKVMSTSGIVAMRFIIQNTFSQRFLPIICSNISSKSRDIRRHCCEFLDQLLHTWPTATLVRKYLIP